MSEIMEALNEFEICEKPKVTKSYQGKYYKLFIALKNLANDSAIKLPLSYIGETKFDNWLMHIKTTARKKYGMKVHAILDTSIIKIFRR